MRAPAKETALRSGGILFESTPTSFPLAQQRANRTSYPAGI